MLTLSKITFRPIFGALLLSSAVFLTAPGNPARAENPALSAAAGALKTGKFAYVIKTLDKALKNGGLSTKDMSKALLYRGLAYQSTKKPAQSIADLTNAIWMGGLTPAERAEALKYRALAYGVGGVSDRAKADAAEATRLAKSLPKITPLVGRPANIANNASKSSGGFGSGISDFFGNIIPGSSSAAVKTAVVAVPTVAAPAIKAPTALTRPAVSARAITQKTRTALRPTKKPIVSGWATNVSETAQAPVKKPTTSSGLGLGGVSDFFGNMFGGASKPANKPVSAPRPIRVTSLQKTAPSNFKPSVQKMAKTATLVPNKVARVGASRAQGRYRLQIATVRSKDEAKTIVSSINSRHSALVVSHPARIEEAVVGNMGTFYRVRLEAFADKRSALKTCNKLRASGLDCFPVGR